MQRAYPFTARDVVCFHTAPTFVDSIWQIFGPLLEGIPLLVLPPPAPCNMAALLTALRQHAATHFVAVPTLLAALQQHLELSGQQSELISAQARLYFCPAAMHTSLLAALLLTSSLLIICGKALEVCDFINLRY